LLAPRRAVRAFEWGGQAVSYWFLLLLVTVGNLAIGFGIGLHFGFGPDMSRVHTLVRDLVAARRTRKPKPAASAGNGS
jgi:hypothetical protein